MSGAILLSPRQQFLDARGVPLAGGSVEVYRAGTTTPATTWQDRYLTAANLWPVPLDANGSCTIYVDAALTYKTIVRSASVAGVAGAIQPHYSADNILVGGEAPTISQRTVDLFSGTGAPASYTLSVTPNSKASTSVHVGGTYVPQASYTLLGNVLTMTAAAGTDNVEVVTTDLIDYTGVAEAVGRAADAAIAAAHIYSGTFPTFPLTRPDGSAIQEGDRLFFDGDENEYIRRSGAWVNFEADANAAADAAATSAAAAETSKDGADSAKTDAEFAQAQAEAARDSLIDAAGVFADTTAGLAGTASGGYFWVPSPNASESYILYLDNAGVAEEKKRLPSATAFTNLAVTAPPGAEYAILDANDNAAVVLDAEGDASLLTLDVNTVNGIPRTELERVTRRTPNMTASIVHHISYGQSLSLGGTSMHSFPSVDGGFFTAQMFNANGVATAGPRAQEGSGTVAQNHASLVAYEERPLSGTTPTGNYESPLGNALRMVYRLMRDEDGVAPGAYDYSLLGSAPGLGNTAIAGLKKGSAPYQKLIDDVTYGLALANAAGKSYAVDDVFWSQGERDVSLNTARATYTTEFLQLYTDLNTDIKALTKQTHDIKLIGYQVTEYDQFTVGYAGPNIALAQLDAAKANQNIILATSIYAIEHTAPNNVHLTGFGSATLGAYYGLAAKRLVVDQGTWKNLYPTRLTRQGVILDAEFPDTGYPLAISNTLFATQANAGLTAVGVDGTTDNPIVSATVVGPRRIRVVLTNALPGFLRYGFASWGGNIHDTNDADAGTAREVRLYQPCLTFDEAFA